MTTKTGMQNQYRGWTFRDRSFILAAALSLLWHFFWFFSIRIVVTSPAKIEKTRPDLVSWGPVMDDAIFKTLIESKPEMSQSFYRRPSDLAAAADLPVETSPRHEAGEVVSVPMGKKFLESLRGFVGGVKQTPDFELSEEEKRKRHLLNRDFGG